MTVGLRRLDNVGVVVEDLDRAVAFFLELGLTLEARMVVAWQERCGSGPWRMYVRLAE